MLLRTYLLILSLFIAEISFSQPHELSLGVGFSQYYGDLNAVNMNNSPLSFLTESFNSKNYKMSYSLGYRLGLKDYFSFGLNYGHLYLSGYDSDNESQTKYDAAFYRKTRNLSFYTTINEFYFDFRFEPFRTEKRWNEPNWLLSPYVGAGIGFFTFNPKTMYQGKEVELQPLGTEGQGLYGYASKYNLTQAVVPVNLGIRAIAPSRKFAVSLEFNYHYTFTDYLDDVSTIYVDPKVFSAAFPAEKANLISSLSNRFQGDLKDAYINGPGQQRGNSARNDNYITGQLKLSWFFSLRKGSNFSTCPAYY